MVSRVVSDKGHTSVVEHLELMSKVVTYVIGCLLHGIHKSIFNALLLWLCSSPTGPVGLIGSDPESGGQVHGNGCEGFSKVIDQHPEEDAKCLQFTRLRIWDLYQNKLW